MGCASSRVMHLQAERDDNLVSAAASPKQCRKRQRDGDQDGDADDVKELARQRHKNHFVALTSSTYGVLDRERRCKDKDVAKDPEVINAVELMKDLEGDREQADHPRQHQQQQKQQQQQQEQQQDCYALSQNSHHPRGSSSNSSSTTYEIVRELHKSDQQQQCGHRHHRHCDRHRRRSSKKMRCVSSKASNSVLGETARSSSSASTTTSCSVFDPELLESMERALEEMSEEEWNNKKEFDRHRESTLPSNPSQEECQEHEEDQDADDGLGDFPRLCPPSGESKAVVYYTSLRGVRRTHEECAALLAILASYGVSIDERDLSMHQAFRQELLDLTHSSAVPKLFVKGRLIGGLEEVSRAHEQGILARLLQGIGREDQTKLCDGCGGARFMLCLDCSGSCKIFEDGSGAKIQCLECNENGLIRCPICC